MTVARQPTDLFDTEARDDTTLVAIAGSQPKLSKAQREFNSLTSRIRGLRDELAQWQSYRQRFSERWIQELEPALKALRDAEVDLVRRIDLLLRRPPAGVKLTRRHKHTLGQYLLWLLDHLLADQTDAELEALYDRHSDVSRDEQRAIERDLTQAVLEEAFGEDVVASFEGGDSEALLRHAQARLAEAAATEAAERQQRAAARSAKRGKPSAAEHAAERKANAAQQASASLREIFRKLASAVHPDRESDAAERERKTLLMKRVNQAYQSEDLLGLLSLQFEIEQIDIDHLAALPEQRLRHYNHVLKEQIRTLEGEIDTLASPLLQEFDLPASPGPLCMRLLDCEFKQRVAAVRTFNKQQCDALTALDDPKRRVQLLDRLAAEQREHDADATAAVFDMFSSAVDTAPPRRRKRGR